MGEERAALSLADAASPLRAALDAMAATVASLTLRRHPVYAASARLSAALSAPIPVSLLSADRYQVCREGAHASV